MKNFIEILKNSSDKKEIEKANKGVHSFWKGILNMTPEDNKKFEIFILELKTFDEIKTEQNKIWFIQSLIYPMMALGKSHIKPWSEFILKNIQNPSVKIRQAILRSADHISIPMDLEEYRFFYDRNPSEQEFEEIEIYKRSYFKFVEDIENLLEKYNKPEFDKYEYVSDIPPCIYKSLQYLLTEKLLRMVDTEVMYQEYLRKKNDLGSDIVEEA